MAGYRRETMTFAVSSMEKFVKTGSIAVSSYAGGGGKNSYRNVEEASSAIKEALKSGTNVDIVAPKGSSGELFRDIIRKDFPQARIREDASMTEIYISGVPKPKIVREFVSSPTSSHYKAPIVVRELSSEEPSRGHRAPVIVSAEEPGVLDSIAKTFRDLDAAYRKGRAPARA
ncbi:MAG TPA: hypothetical protein VI933_03060 [archaeon]|nr:hypothetical protein [archaeon]